MGSDSISCTTELGDALERLLDAGRDARSDHSAEADAHIRDAWIELRRVRMERLVGCLSTPVPKPTE
jgi:hypothetical protein